MLDQGRDKLVQIHLFHKLPTPYNDMLFRELSQSENVHLQVYHLWRSRSNRPWSVELATGYPNIYLDTRLLGVDWRLVKNALTDRRSFFMIGDWARPASIVVLLARILLGAPVAIWADTPQEHLPRPWYKRVPRRLFLSWLLPRMNVVFGTGQPGIKALAAMGVPADRLVNLPCYVDLKQPDQCRADANCRRASRQFRHSVIGDSPGIVFLMSGMCTYKKGQDIGLQAFAQCFHATRANIGLIIAGEGDQRANLERVAQELGVADRVAFVGWLNPDEMLAAYDSSDVLVHSARWDQFPLVILEAMSWGKVVIGSDVSGSVQDRVVHGQNGLCFRSEDVEELASIMEKLVLEPELIEQLGRAARKTAEAWPVERGVETIVQVARQLVHNHR